MFSGEGEDVLYGTQNGRIGLVQLGSEEPVYHWDIDNERREGGENFLCTVHNVLDFSELSNLVSEYLEQDVHTLG